MLIGKSADVRSSEITPMERFLDRRRFLGGAGALGLGAMAAGLMPQEAYGATKLQAVVSPYKVPDAETPITKAASYNNYYEFGTDKGDPAHNAGKFVTRPWTIEVAGLVQKPQTIDLDKVMGYRPLEERVYRMRCVEAWSMVIPWVGYSLSEFIKAMNPLPSAKYVQFISAANKKTMELPSGFDWPYSEGLRMDEAMHPLTLLTFGYYGQTLENQSGAPVRVMIPWKYGFKSPKAIVKMVFTDKQPKTLWNDLMVDTYGFYSNVNPNVERTPWSQTHERRLDASVFPKSIPTQMFNGYGDQVASLYSGMDLKKNY